MASLHNFWISSAILSGTIDFIFSDRCCTLSNDFNINDEGFACFIALCMPYVTLAVEYRIITLIYRIIFFIGTVMGRPLQSLMLAKYYR
jgi:hypothetical protein